MRIPITKPYLNEEEAEAARETILSGWLTQGPKVKAFEEQFADYVGARHACAVSSCTTALHLALLAVGVKPGNVVITVSHSFIATANVIRHCGAEPIFVDINPDTYNIDINDLKRVLSEDCEKRENGFYYRQTEKLLGHESPLGWLYGSFPEKIKNGTFGKVAAILAVHQLGYPCEIFDVVEVGKKYGLPVIEDAACAIGSEIRSESGKNWEKIGKPHGEIACFSFHPRKVITTGDGGMITCNDAGFDQFFRLLRQHGMTISDVDRHQAKNVVIEKYETTAYNYRMTDIQAAIGTVQLKKLPEILQKRREVDRLYRKYFSGVNWIKLPHEDMRYAPNWQSYPVRILAGSPVSALGLMQYLLENDIASKPGVMNAHQETPYKANHTVLECSEEARETVVLLPVFPDMSEKHIQEIYELFIRLT